MQKLRDLTPGIGYFFSHFTQKLRQSFSLGNDWEEIRIIAPSWDYVLVQMRRYPSSGNSSLIHAYVETVGSPNFFKHSH
jgi:hypothetical protein